MLVNMNEVLAAVQTRGCCVGAFDTPNLEILMAVIRAAEKRKEPVIIQHAQLHEPEMALRVIGPIMGRMAKESTVPVCVMLDHGEDLDYVKKALDLGFSAVMYDGSSRPYEENVRMTRETVAMAQEYSANVEAEIGIVTGHEGKEFVGGAYTDPELAAKYVKETGIDALAASVVQILFWGLVILCMPLGLLLMIVFGFWFSCEICCQIVYGDLDRVFHIEENIRKMKDAELEAALAAERASSGQEDEPGTAGGC